MVVDVVRFLVDEISNATSIATLWPSLIVVVDAMVILRGDAVVMVSNLDEVSLEIGAVEDMAHVVASHALDEASSRQVVSPCSRSPRE